VGRHWVPSFHLKPAADATGEPERLGRPISWAKRQRSAAPFFAWPKCPSGRFREGHNSHGARRDAGAGVGGVFQLPYLSQLSFEVGELHMAAGGGQRGDACPAICQGYSARVAGRSVAGLSPDARSRSSETAEHFQEDESQLEMLLDMALSWRLLNGLSRHSTSTVAGHHGMARSTLPDPRVYPYHQRAWKRTWRFEISQSRGYGHLLMCCCCLPSSVPRYAEKLRI